MDFLIMKGSALAMLLVGNQTPAVGFGGKVVQDLRSKSFESFCFRHVIKLNDAVLFHLA
jgi:hypothetical protein